ncbi:MAG TPA: hypothetical protein DCR40_20705 [Prolixibacteraceae bacterium]|nr:hypothetical protein [Prolixibacteraceae bacterium]
MNKYPDSIYHYTSVEKLFLILGNFQLKMNTLKNTNDPREKMEIKPSVHVKAKNAYKALQIFWKRDININTITCFSGDTEDTKGFDLPTMWAHYGDKYRGVTLKICPIAFIEENDNTLYFDKVRYEKPKAEIGVEGEMSLEELRQLIFFSKRPDWNSEAEWRLLSLNNERMCNIRKSLKSIILGLDFHNAFLPSINKLIQGENINIQQLKLDNDSQSFYVETISCD